MTVEQLSTSKISSTCPTGVNYISKYAGDLREKSHEVWTWNSNRSRCTVKKTTGGGGANGIRVKSWTNHVLYKYESQLEHVFIINIHCVYIHFTSSEKWEICCTCTHHAYQSAFPYAGRCPREWFWVVPVALSPPLRQWGQLFHLNFISNTIMNNFCKVWLT